MKPRGLLIFISPADPASFELAACPDMNRNPATSMDTPKVFEAHPYKNCSKSLTEISVIVDFS